MSDIIFYKQPAGQFVWQNLSMWIKTPSL